MGWLDLFRLRTPEKAWKRAGELHKQASGEYNRGLMGCEKKYIKAYQLYESVGDREKMAQVALGLGRVYLHIRGLRSLSNSRQWYERALDMSRQELTRAQAYGSLALWEQQYIGEQTTELIVPDELVPHLDRAEELYRKALDLLPENEHISLGVTYKGLALVMERKGAVNEAEEATKKAIREYVFGGDEERAATSRLNLSSMMIHTGRLQDALSCVSDAIEALEAIPPADRSVDWNNFHQAAVKQHSEVRDYLNRNA